MSLKYVRTTEQKEYCECCHWVPPKNPNRRSHHHLYSNTALVRFRGQDLCGKCLLSDSIEDEIKALAPAIQNENVYGAFRGQFVFRDSWALGSVTTSMRNFHGYQGDGD